MRSTLGFFTIVVELEGVVAILPDEKRCKFHAANALPEG